MGASEGQAFGSMLVRVQTIWVLSHKLQNKRAHSVNGNTPAGQVCSKASLCQAHRLCPSSDFHIVCIAGIGVRGTFPNLTGTSCWLASLLQSFFACGRLVESFLQHQKMACGTCWRCAFRDTETASRAQHATTDLPALWEQPLQSVDVSFDAQQDPLEILGKFFAQDVSGLENLTLQHVHTLTHEKQCTCAIEMPHPHAPPVAHFHALLRLPAFDETTALCLPDLLDEPVETIEDGGLPCPNCSTLTKLHAASSWQLGPVALLQLVRESFVDGAGAMNRTAVFAPHQFERHGRDYVLRAAVLHRGDHFHRGHYIAFVPGTDGTWLQYNDGDIPKRLPREPTHLQTHARYFLYEAVAQLPCSVTLTPEVGPSVFSCFVSVPSHVLLQSP